VQSDQVTTVEEMLAARDIPVVQSAAIVPMRIAAINGVAVAPTTPGEQGASAQEDEMYGFDDTDGQDRPAGWATRREYRSTYRDTMTAGETLVSGRWWDTGAGDGERAGGAPYQVSLDEEVAAELRVGVGDTITWDVQGIRVPTLITSLRSIDWARLEPNFFAVFEPAALGAAPQMWVFLARADSAQDRALLQRDLVSRHPNIATIDLTLIQRALDEVIGRVSMVIRFLAGFSVATGFVVMLGAVATGRPQRIRESVLLKTLGATRAQIGRILVTEYALLGMLSALVGIALALLAGWGIARWILGVPLVVEAGSLLVLGGAITLLSAAIGLSASRDVFRTTPMEAIREG
jgi:putative ABC transport system permease protein